MQKRIRGKLTSMPWCLKSNNVSIEGRSDRWFMASDMFFCTLGQIRICSSLSSHSPQNQHTPSLPYLWAELYWFRRARKWARTIVCIWVLDMILYLEIMCVTCFWQSTESGKKRSILVHIRSLAYVSFSLSRSSE